MSIQVSKTGVLQPLALTLVIIALFATACASQVTITASPNPASTNAASTNAVSPTNDQTVGNEVAATDPSNEIPNALPDADTPVDTAGGTEPEAESSVVGDAETAAAPTSPDRRQEEPAPTDAPPTTSPDSGTNSLDDVRVLIPEPLPSSDLTAYEQQCSSEAQPLRWVGNGLNVTNVAVAGDTFADRLVAELDDGPEAEDSHWNMCILLLPEPNAIRACRGIEDHFPSYELEGVRAIAFLDKGTGEHLTTSMVLFGPCFSFRDEDDRAEFSAQVIEADGPIPNSLRLIWLENFVTETLNFAGAEQDDRAFSDAQCQQLAAALVRRADFVHAANETFGMETYGRLGSQPRVPTTQQVQELRELIISAGRVGERTRLQFFGAGSFFARAFRLDGDAVIGFGSVYGQAQWQGSTAHDAAALLAESSIRASESDPGELLRRGLVVLEGGCTPEQITELDPREAAGMERFDVGSSDSSVVCGWLQGMYGHRLEHRRALAVADFEAAEEYQTRFLTTGAIEDLNRVEPFLPNDEFAFASVERTVAELVDPNREPPPNAAQHAPGYQESQGRVDAFAQARCGNIPDFLFDVPTIAQVQAGASPSLDDLPPLPNFPYRFPYRTTCGVWSDFYSARAALWKALPTSPTTTSPSENQLALRREYDSLWLSNQSLVATRPGFAPLIGAWNTMTVADRALWVAATEGRAAVIDEAELAAADQTVIAAVRIACRDDDEFDASTTPPSLPPLANG